VRGADKGRAKRTSLRASRKRSLQQQQQQQNTKTARAMRMWADGLTLDRVENTQL
jgi:hypothetical protein